MAGQSELDAGEWRAAARHEGGCERAPQLAWFWSMVSTRTFQLRCCCCPTVGLWACCVWLAWFWALVSM